MGYNTTFTGELKFVEEATAGQLAALSAMFGEDCRDHPEWEKSTGLYYVDLALNDDFSGIKWDDQTEKTYDLDRIVNVVILEMRKKWPSFGLTGQLLAQGESVEDRWALVIGPHGMAEKQKIAFTGQIVTCPHCEHRFALESAGSRND